MKILTVCCGKGLQKLIKLDNKCSKKNLVPSVNLRWIYSDTLVDCLEYLNWLFITIWIILLATLRRSNSLDFININKMADAQVVGVGRGCVLIHDGYMYQGNQRRTHRIYWRCCINGCASKVRTNVFQHNNIILQNVPSQHNHEPQAEVIEWNAVIREMIQTIQAYPTLASGIYDDVLAPKIWNAIPEELKNWLTMFKQNLKLWDGPNCACKFCKYTHN